MIRSAIIEMRIPPWFHESNWSWFRPLWIVLKVFLSFSAPLFTPWGVKLSEKLFFLNFGVILIENKSLNLSAKFYDLYDPLFAEFPICFAEVRVAISARVARSNVSGFGDGTVAICICIFNCISALGASTVYCILHSSSFILFCLLLVCRYRFPGLSLRKSSMATLPIMFHPVSARLGWGTIYTTFLQHSQGTKTSSWFLKLNSFKNIVIRTARRFWLFLRFE